MPSSVRGDEGDADRRRRSSARTYANLLLRFVVPLDEDDAGGQLYMVRQHTQIVGFAHGTADGDSGAAARHTMVGSDPELPGIVLDQVHPAVDHRIAVHDIA